MGKWYSADYFDFGRVRESPRFGKIQPGDRAGTGVGADFSLWQQGLLFSTFAAQEGLSRKFRRIRAYSASSKDVASEVFCTALWRDAASSKSLMTGTQSPCDWGLSWGRRFPRVVTAQ